MALTLTIDTIQLGSVYGLLLDGRSAETSFNGKFGSSLILILVVPRSRDS